MVIESVSINISPECEYLLNWEINGHNIDKYHWLFINEHANQFSKKLLIQINNNIYNCPGLDTYLRIMLADDFIRNRP